MARILLGWELGGGHGHARRLIMLAQALTSNGHDCHFAACNPKRLVESGVPLDRVHSVVQWPRVATNLHKQVAAETFGDLLAELLFADAEEVFAQAEQWRKLIATCKADLVIADYAIGLLLGARGRVPVLNIGDSYYLPPSDMESFPQLFSRQPIKPESEALEHVNSALARLGCQAASSLPKSLSADDTVVANFPVLDIYGSIRSSSAIGPLEEMPGVATGPAQKLFGYFRKGSEHNVALMKGIIGARLPGRVIIPGMARSPAAGFLNPLVFSHVFADLKTTLNGTAVAVTHGGAQTVAAILSAGVPQVVVSADGEKNLTARCLVRHGVGINLPATRLQSENLVHAISSANTHAMRDRAYQEAQNCQKILETRPLNVVVEKIERLLRS